MYCVYILSSLVDPTAHYTGITGNLEERLAKHNQGGCPHTAKFMPWRVETYTVFTDKQKAVDFESYLKSGSGREFARRHF
jgi:putative endonuclease